MNYRHRLLWSLKEAPTWLSCSMTTFPAFPIVVIKESEACLRLWERPYASPGPYCSTPQLRHGLPPDAPLHPQIPQSWICFPSCWVPQALGFLSALSHLDLFTSSEELFFERTPNWCEAKVACCFSGNAAILAISQKGVIFQTVQGGLRRKGTCCIGCVLF